MVMCANEFKTKEKKLTELKKINCNICYTYNPENRKSFFEILL